MVWKRENWVQSRQKKKKILSPPAFSSLPPFLLSFSTVAFSHHHSHHQLDHHHLHQPSSSPTIEQLLRTHLSPPSASIFSFFPQLTPTTTPSSNASWAASQTALSPPQPPSWATLLPFSLLLLLFILGCAACKTIIQVWAGPVMAQLQWLGRVRPRPKRKKKKRPIPVRLPAGSGSAHIFNNNIIIII